MTSRVHSALFMGLTLGALYSVWLNRDKLSLSGEGLEYQEVALDNMTERTRSIINANMVYGGVPDPTPIDLVKMLTGTPIQSEYNPGVTL